MPAAYLMAWEPTRRRWWKQYREHTRTSPAGQAANTWWLAKKSEIDGKLPPHPYAQTLQILGQREVDHSLFAQSCQDRRLQSGPDFKLRPEGESPPAATPAAAIHLFGEGLPRDAGLEHEDDACQRLANWER